MSQESNAPPSEEGLGFDIRTMIMEFFGYWYIPLIAMVVGGPTAYLLAMKVGKQQFAAESVLLYRPVALIKSTDGQGAPTVALRTLVDMVKLPTNLGEARRRLALPMTLEQIAGAIGVEIRGKTDLLAISATSTEPDVAAKLCRMIRDLFLIDQAKRIREDGTRTLKRQWEQALRDVKGLEVQADDLQQRIEELRREVGRERSMMRGRNTMSRISKRLIELQDEVRANGTVRKNAIDLARTEQDYLRTKKLVDRGVGSRSVLEAKRAAYEKAKVLASDSRKLQKIKAEILRLQASSSDVAGSTQLTASEMMLQQTLARSVELGLKWVAAKEKATYLENESELILQKPLDIKTDETGFKIMTEATVPRNPKKSSRRIIFGGVLGAALCLSLALAAFLAVVSRMVRSPGELRLKMQDRILGVLPRVTDKTLKLPDDPAAQEVLRLMVARIRELVPSEGARVIVSSAVHGEGRSVVTAMLARGLTRLGLKVLVLDCNLPGRGGAKKDEKDQEEAEAAAASATPPAPSVGEVSMGRYLRGDLSLEEITFSTQAEGFDRLPIGDGEIAPESLGSDRMRDLLRRVGQLYNFVLVDGPPVLPYVDFEHLVREMNGVLLVVRANHVRSEQVQRTDLRLKSAKTTVLGVVLNDVHKRHRQSLDASGG